MADVGAVPDAVRAAALGADLIATTLAGYAPDSPRTDGPDLPLVAAIRRELPGAFLVAEGRFSTPDEVRAALDLGADAVVVGTAITDVAWITARFAAAAR